MVWSPADEMRTTLNKVQQFANQLKTKSVEPDRTHDVKTHPLSTAPGSLQNQSNHRGYEVDMSQSSPLLTLPVTGSPLLELFKNKDVSNTEDLRDNIESHVGPEEKKMKMNNISCTVSRSSYPRTVH